MSEERKRRNAGPHRGPGAPHEKPKDLTGTWKKIIGYNRKDGILLIVALCCAVVATVFTLLGPNKLGDLTNLITDGIKPDTDKMLNCKITYIDANISLYPVLLSNGPFIFAWNRYLKKFAIDNAKFVQDFGINPLTNTNICSIICYMI